MSDIELPIPKRLCLPKQQVTSSQNDDAEMVASAGSILNDFCLLKILNRLDLDDLCNTVNVSQQFKRVSIMAFSARYRTFCYPDNLKMYFPPNTDSLRFQMRRVLSSFGHLIKSMKIRDFSPAGTFIGMRLYPIDMDAISKYCAGTLEELKLKIFIHFQSDSAKPLFSSLKSLSLSHAGVFDDDAVELFSGCNELKSLRVSRLPYNEFVSEIAHKYPKLEQLYIHDAAVNAETVIALLKLNPQIKTVDIIGGSAIKSISAVASEMGSLEKLALKDYHQRDYGNASEFVNLKSLKVFELDGIDDRFVVALNAMENISLDRFKWLDCPSNLEFTNSIKKWKSLKSLSLATISSAFEEFFLNIGVELPLLEELELGFKHQPEFPFSITSLHTFVQGASKLNELVIHTVHSHLFNQKFYDSMAEVLQRRTSAEKLRIKIRDTVLPSLQMHSNLLRVEFLAREEYCTCNHCEPGDPNDILDYWIDDDDYDDDYLVDWDDL